MLYTAILVLFAPVFSIIGLLAQTHQSFGDPTPHTADQTGL
jgi:hypothetical protein